MPRSYSLTLVSTLFFASQFVVTSVGDIDHLWMASSILGLAYGSIFSLMPTVCLEWFGMRMLVNNFLLSKRLIIFLSPLFRKLGIPIHGTYNRRQLIFTHFR